MTGAEFECKFQSTKDTPYLALTGELWDVFCDDSGENWPRYNGTALYYTGKMTLMHRNNPKAFWSFDCYKLQSVFSVSNSTFSHGLLAACLSIHPWWRHQMETFSALLAICAGNSPVSGEFPAQRPVTWSFYVFCTRINGWVNNWEAGDLRRIRPHYDVTVIIIEQTRCGRLSNCQDILTKCLKT